jgi:FKBP-type peptidyl-prolyl cis-trans isomerase FklB
MKKILIASLFCLLISQTFAQHNHTKLKTQIDSVSYALGMNIASSLKSGGIDTLNYTVFSEALKDLLQYNHANMDGQLSNTVINNYVSQIKALEMEKFTAEGTAFLAENAKKKGVITLPSGLQYKVITKGTGAIPTENQRVKTHYRGTLINGKQFDSSYDRGEPATFGVTQVIAGWTEALKMMPVGSKWELFIPYNLAYGERAMGSDIPAYSTLIFTIELLEIVP